MSDNARGGVRVQRNSGIQVGEDGSIWIAAKSGGGLAKDGAGQWYIQNGAITADRLADGAVTAAKLASDVSSKFDDKADQQNGNGGFAGGDGANAGRDGAAIGQGSYAYRGGAVGYGTATGNGFAGGYNAKTQSDGMSIDAIQLGTGTNTKERTLQVYDYTLMDAKGMIPTERLPLYSTEPQRIGTWIDGRPILRVVISRNLDAATVQSGSYQLDTTDLGVEYPDGITIITNAYLRTYNPSSHTFEDSLKAEIGELLNVTISTKKNYTLLTGVIEFVTYPENIV